MLTCRIFGTIASICSFRILQVLGAYGFRGYFEKKPHFIQSIPFALNNLRELLKDGFDEYPYLTKVLQEMTELKQFTDVKSVNWRYGW